MGIDYGYGIGSVKPGVCTSTTRPASPYTGQYIFETDTNITQVWNGSGWVIIGNPNRMPISSDGNISSASGIATETANFHLGNGRTASGYAHIDLVGDTTYSDYGARFIRGNSGANTYTSIEHRGTGALSLVAYEAAAISMHTNNISRMTIDSSGRVVMPYQPYVHAYSNAANTTWSAGSTYVFPFNLTVANVGSHFNTSTYAFTAPIAGRYFVQAQIQWSSTITSNWVFNLGVYKNASMLAGTFQAGENIAYDKQMVMAIVNASANDTIDIRAAMNQTVGSPETSPGDARNSLFITLLN
jgi:hypothetical protein